MGKKQELNTQEVIDRLGAMFSSPVYGFITQVRSGTGYGDARTADAMAMSLWPSRGLHISGFEVKVFRNDWLSELKKPSKAEEIGQFCHYWYLVAGSEDIVKEGELPDSWGLIVPKGKGLKVIQKPTLNPDVVQMNYMMIAGIFRNIAERCTPNELIQPRIDEAYENGQDWAKYSSKQLEIELRKLQELIKVFEKASGVELNSWNSDDTRREIGEAVKLVLAGKDKQGKKRLGKILVRAKNLVKYLEGEDVSEYEC